MAYQPTNIMVVTPTTGTSVTVPPGNKVTIVVKPATLLATLTLVMTAAPNDGDRVTASFTQAITLLTMTSSPATLQGALSSVTVNTFASWQYVKSITTWVRVG